MNFEAMWSIHNNSDLLSVFSLLFWNQVADSKSSFWKIALPIMVLVVPLALWGDLQKFWHYIQKTSATKKAINVSHLDHLPFYCSSFWHRLIHERLFDGWPTSLDKFCLPAHTISLTELSLAGCVHYHPYNNATSAFPFPRAVIPCNHSIPI